MAQRIVYRLEDDLDNSEAAETIVFGIDSVSYEIDLSEANAQKLRDLLSLHVAAGRRGRSPQVVADAAGSGAAPPVRSAPGRPRTVNVSARGRVPAEVREAHDRAHG